MAERVERLDGHHESLEHESLPEGLGLWDIAPATAGLSLEMQRFYEGCHRSNLRAIMRSHRGSGATVSG
jgi:hypothetical protein